VRGAVQPPPDQRCVVTTGATQASPSQTEPRPPLFLSSQNQTHRLRQYRVISFISWGWVPVPRSCRPPSAGRRAAERGRHRRRSTDKHARVPTDKHAQLCRRAPAQHRGRRPGRIPYLIGAPWITTPLTVAGKWRAQRLKKIASRAGHTLAGSPTCRQHRCGKRSRR
jgi:hypothetical protein